MKANSEQAQQQQKASDQPMTGLTHIAAAFAAAHAQGRAALMPYFTLGFPDRPTSLEVLRAVCRAGADLVELGMPFSDPLADGPTIQRSTQRALENGASLTGCLELTAELRAGGASQPFFLMGYINPILAFGLQRFVAAASAAGADGFIVPDLPPEEAGEMEAACSEHGRALVYLLAPSSPLERIEQIAARTSGFLYLVSLSGVTGARQALPPDLAAFVGRARRVAQTPLAVGFGISTPAQACTVGRLADGVIVGSALIDATERAEHPAQAAAEFVMALRQAL
jgi:tryptophan synthase alpha chain